MEQSKQKKVTVDLDNETPYFEPDSKLYRFKRRLMYSNLLRIIDKYLRNSSSSNFLEVGTGSGFLLSFLEKKYPKLFFKGIEYDHRLVELSNSKLSRSKVYQGDAEHFEGIGNFDVIVSSQVIEHLYQPENFITSAKRTLKVDGVLIFTTPNLACLSHRILGTKWHGFRSDHVSLKSRKEWDQLMIDNGFDILYSGSTFFSGIPLLNKFPLGIINWTLLFFVGSMRWDLGESYVGVFRIRKGK